MRLNISLDFRGHMTAMLLKKNKMENQIEEAEKKE